MHLSPQPRRHVVNLERQWERQILLRGELIDEHRPAADQPEAIEVGYPVVDIGNRSRRSTEHTYLALIGQLSPGDEVDEHLRHRGIDAPNGERFTRMQLEVLDAKRTESVICLRDTVYFDEQFGLGHARAPRSRAHSASGSVDEPGSTASAGSP